MGCDETALWATTLAMFTAQLMMPLIYAPLLPLIRISLRDRPVFRDRVFGTAVLGMPPVMEYWFVGIFSPLVYITAAGLTLQPPKDNFTPNHRLPNYLPKSFFGPCLSSELMRQWSMAQTYILSLWRVGAVYARPLRIIVVWVQTNAALVLCSGPCAWSVRDIQPRFNWRVSRHKGLAQYCMYNLQRIVRLMDIGLFLRKY
jgi:hypothetical protein